MNTSKIIYIMLGAAALAATYLWVDMPPRPGRVETVAVQSATESIRSNGDLNHYRSVLITRHLDAWEARRQLQLRQRTMSSLVSVQGGMMSLGTTHYFRNRDTAEFEIRQEISVALPTSLNWGQLRSDLLRMTSYMPEAKRLATQSATVAVTSR